MNFDTGTEGLRPPSTASALVRKLGALTMLSEDEIAYLEGLQVNTLRLPRGEDFIVEGKVMNATFIIKSGWAIRYAVTSEGRRQILSVALPGDIFGLHVNFRRFATYNAQPLNQAELAVLDPLRTIEISQRFPVLASGLSWCTAREFSILGDQAVRLGRLSAYRRIAHFFAELWHRLKLVDEAGKDEDDWIDVPMTQADVADTLGLSLVHTNRELQRLRKEGLISNEGRRLRIHDIEALCEVGEFDSLHLAEFELAS